MPRDRSARTRIARGIYRDSRGFELQACVGGERKALRLPLSTSRAALSAAMEDLRAGLRRVAKRRRSGRPTKGTLAALAPDYLAARKAMPSYASRRRQVELWVSALGDRPIDKITALEVQTQLQRWLTEPRGDDLPPYSPQYVRHLHSALVDVYAVLRPDDPNPARAVDRVAPPEALPRAIPVPDLLRILRHFPRGSKNRARLAVMASTGLGPAEVMRVRREDVSLEQRLVQARARRKAKGAPPRTIPLTRHAVRAFRLFVQLDAFGAFSTSNLRRDFRAAATDAGYVLKDQEHPDGLDWRPYDARHTFGTAVGTLSRDERAVQQLLGHADIRTTRRYTGASVDPRVAAAIAALDGGRRMGPKMGAENKRKA